MKQGNGTTSNQCLLTDDEVKRAALRIALNEFSDLEERRGSLSDAETLRLYIEMCPFLPRDSSAISAALKGLDDESALGRRSVFLKPSKSPQIHPVSCASSDSSCEDLTPRSLPYAAPRKIEARHGKTSGILSHTILLLVRFFILDTSLALMFALYLVCLWTHHVHDLYWMPMLKELEWSKSRHELESTYYRRPCDPEDMSTTRPEDLFLPENAAPEEVYQHQLDHGTTMFRNILSDETSAALRDFVVSRNYNLSDSESIFVIANKHRYSFGLGTEEPSVVDAMKEIATNPNLIEPLELILGTDPALIEMAAITATYGAKDQYWHDDVVSRASVIRFARAFGPSYSLFVQLQNTTKEMGATSFCPGTHYCSVGGMETFCEEMGFQMINDDGYWRAGDAILMNMNSYHRGPAHTVKGGLDRVMLILTFVPKPKTRAETRQMSQGITFSLRWDMWGHTLRDLAQADTRMAQPWATLRALGLYKFKDANWGIDWITGSAMRMASEDNGYQRDDLDKCLENGGLYYVPKFLHGEVSDEENWYEYYIRTLVNVERFSKKLNISAIFGYLAIHIMVFAFGFVIKGDQASKKTTSLRLRNALMRLAISHGALILLYLTAIHHVDHTEWARDIRANRLYRRPFLIEEDAYRGPTTFPHRNDVLIETRYSSRYLAMYNDFVANHPGSRAYFRQVTDLASVHKSLAQSPIFRDAVPELIVGEMYNQARRFLYQNPQSHWVLMSKEDAVAQVKKDLLVRFNPFVFKMSREVDFLLSELKYGWLRETSLAQIDSLNCLEIMKEKLLGVFEQHRPGGTDFFDLILPDKKQASNPFPRLFDLGRVALNSKFRRRVVKLSVGTLPGEPEDSAWIREGDLVEALTKGSKKKKAPHFWYPAVLKVVSSSSSFAVKFKDGDSGSFGRSQVRRYHRAEVGETLEVLLDDKFHKAVVERANEDGTYDVKSVESGTLVTKIGLARIRRPET